MTGAGSGDEFIFHKRLINGQEVIVATRNLERCNDDPYFDPNFFDEDYDLSAATGFQLWEATQALITLLDEAQHACDSVKLFDRVRGKRVVELGSGTGLLSLCAAAAGAHTLATDLPVLVQAIKQNIGRNVDKNSNATATAGPLSMNQGGAATCAWEGSQRVGDGSMAAQVLDWTRPLAEQVHPNDPRNAEVILAADVVWLRSLLKPFVATVTSILASQAPLQSVLFLSYRDRGKRTGGNTVASSEPGAAELGEGDGSAVAPTAAAESQSTFTIWPEVERELLGAGCVITELWRTKSTEEWDRGRDIRVFEVRLAKSALDS